MGGIIPNFLQKKNNFQRHIDLLVRALKVGKDGKRSEREASLVIESAIGWLRAQLDMLPKGRTEKAYAAYDALVAQLKFFESTSALDVTAWFSKNIHRRLNPGNVVSGLTSR